VSLFSAGQCSGRCSDFIILYPASVCHACGSEKALDFRLWGNLPGNKSFAHQNEKANGNISLCRPLFTSRLFD